MKNAKKMAGILLACLMLLSSLSMGVCAAAGDQDNPINAETKWFGYGVDTYLLNPTISAGATNGMWYTLTAKNAGVLFLEHSYKNVDYTIYITLNGVTYEGGCVNGEPYNRPIVTAPMKAGDVATIQVLTKDAAAGTVYASMNVIAGDVDDPIKVKSNGLDVVVGAGQTLYFQDDSLNAIYATMGLLVEGNVANTTFYTVSKNSESGTVVKKAVTDSDNDGTIEAKLGGSLGGAGVPAVKPGWAIENKSSEDRAYTLTIVDAAHECNWDDNTDTDCNTCGAVREIPTCDHKYATKCDTVCTLCGEERNDAPHYPVGDYACNKMCCVCWADLTTAAHVYSFELDTTCDVCGEGRDIDLPILWDGQSVSTDVSGLAMRYTVEVQGMKADGPVAIYDNATITANGTTWKLTGMGAVVSNNFEETNQHPTLEDVNDYDIINVPAVYLCELTDTTASFAVRVKDIPDHGKDTLIMFVPYLIVEDTAGNEQILYVNEWAASNTYNEVLGNI